MKILFLCDLYQDQINLYNDEFDRKFVDGIKTLSTIIQGYE